MDAMEALFTRRSVRKFTGEPLPAQILEQIITAGMCAPSAHNKSPWHFLTVEDEARRLTLRPLCKWWQMLDQTGVVVAVCADPALGIGMPAEYQVDDCAAACENMLLATHALGYGGVWLGLCEASPYAVPVKELLGIPSEMRIMGMLALGVPSEPARDLDKQRPAQWHKGAW